MNKIAKRKLQLATLLFSILFTSSVSISSAETKVEATEKHTTSKVLANVNGKPIYAEQVNAVIKTRFPNSGYTQENSEKNFQNIDYQKHALEKIIPSELIYQESQKLAIPDLDKKIEHLTTTFKNHPLGHYTGKTDEELRELAKRQIYAGEYFTANKLYSPTIPESEVKKYYEANKQSFATKDDSIKVRHIFVSHPEEISDANIELAINKITEARNLIGDGQDFADIAEKYSEDSTAANGGDLGFIQHNFMPAEFDAVAFNLAPGQLSEVVKTGFGYHVLEVTEVVPKGTIPSYEDLKDFFEEFLVNQKSKMVIEEHILALREKAEIEFLLD